MSLSLSKSFFGDTCVFDVIEPTLTVGTSEFFRMVHGVTVFSEENIKWLEENLNHRKMTPEELDQNYLFDLVTSETPPVFLVHAYDDDVCKMDESAHYAQPLFENNVSVKMYLFPRGGRGFRVRRKEDGTDQWVGLFVNWLRTHGA